jgi:hypothetical protein
MKKLSSSLMVSALALAVLAQAVEAGGYLTPMRVGVTVTDYMVNNNVGHPTIGGLTIFVSGISNPDGCGGTDMVHIKNTAPGYKEMFAAVVAAVAQGKKIGFHASGCETLPFWGGSTTFPVITDLWVVN